MDTAQELLQQPIVLIALAGLFILSAVILFIIPLFMTGFDKFQSLFSSSPKKPAKKTVTESVVSTKGKEKEPQERRVDVDAKKIALIVLAMVVGVIVVLGIWAGYVYFIEKNMGQPNLTSKPSYKFQYEIAGPVKKVDHEKGTLIVRDESSKKNYTLKMNTLTKAFLGEKEVRTTEIKEGTEVTVRSNANFDDEEVTIFEVSISTLGVEPDLGEPLGE
jgi:Cu/Ag efflux protein CusF